MKKTVVELFAGVGGFRCGLNNVKLIDEKVVENSKWQFLWANQWEPSTKSQEAYDCYTKRFGIKDVSNIDIFQVDKNTIPSHTLLVGGFPCQDYSVAQSLSKSEGIKGKKGVLWWAINEILKIKKPPFVLLENVDRILLSPASQRGRDFGIILKCFYDNRYDVEWRVINAGEYNFPQKRRRIYIFAYNQNTKYYKNQNKLNYEKIIFKDSIFAKQFPIKQNFQKYNHTSILNYENIVDVSNNFKFDFYNSGIMQNGKIYTYKVETIITNIFPLKNIREKGIIDDKYFLSQEKLDKFLYLKSSKRIPRIKLDGNKYMYTEGTMPFPDNLEMPARTILTSESSLSRSSHVIEDYKTKKLRLITPIESERINGFPDNWTNTGMSDKKRYFMMGNALIVGIVEKLGLEIEKIVEKE